MSYNEITFKETEVKQYFIETILQSFKDDKAHEKDYWYNLFGEREMEYCESLDESEINYPCFTIELYPLPDTKYIHSFEVEQYSLVNFTIQVFNKRVGTNSKEYIGEQINYRIKQALQSNFKVTITMNEAMPNLYDTQVYRRYMRGSFGYDNQNKIFYKGE